MDPKKSWQTWILAIAALALLLRLGLFALALARPERVIASDSYSYINPAMALLETGYYSYPVTVATPTYPVSIAFVYALFGENPLVLVAFQVFLGIGTLYLTYRLGLALGIPRTPSVLAALLLSLSLETLFSPFFVLTDTLFTFLLVSATFALASFLHNKKWLWLIGAAILSGAAILCRPVAIVYEAVVILILLMDTQSHFIKRALYSVVHLLLVGILFIAPWVWRNEQITGTATFTSKSGYFWLSWSAAPLYADLNHVSVDQADEELLARVDEILRQRGLEPTEANLDAVKTEVAKEILLAHPVQYIFLHLRYDLQNFLPGLGYPVKYLQLSQGDTQGMEILQSQGLAAVIQNYFGGDWVYVLVFAPFLLMLLAVYTGAAAGTVDLARKKQWLALAVLLLTAAYFLLVPGYASNSRYRIPAMPFLALLAGVGLTALWGFLKQKLAKRRRPAA
jgi:4-amino-4-deoxy-L-arabinose transferase-like glycosyltransferase